ncbi:UNVERIFIED_ORG: hypothetical protein QOE_2062 [Clostridioides difficile F501]
MRTLRGVIRIARLANSSGRYPEAIQYVSGYPIQAIPIQHAGEIASKGGCSFAHWRYQRR